jgi:hypothetical protein
MSRTHSSRQAGFAHLVTFLVIALVVGTVAFIGYKLYAKPTADTSGQASVVNTSNPDDVPDAPEIKNSGDLDKAVNTLNKVDPTASNKSDAASLDSQTNSIR